MDNHLIQKPHTELEFCPLVCVVPYYCSVNRSELIINRTIFVLYLPTLIQNAINEKYRRRERLQNGRDYEKHDEGC